MVSEKVLENEADYGLFPDYDGLWKRIIEDLFEEFMLFFAPDLHEEINFSRQPEFLKQELFERVIKKKKGKKIADEIVKVHLKDGKNKWILIHVEVQGEDGDKFSKRMFQYFYRIFDKYDKEVYAIALMTGDRPIEFPAAYRYDFHCTHVHYVYNAYRFHDHTIEELEASNNPFALAIIAGKYANVAR